MLFLLFCVHYVTYAKGDETCQRPHYEDDERKTHAGEQILLLIDNLKLLLYNDFCPRVFLQNIARIAKAALHKLPGKLNLNV